MKDEICLAHISRGQVECYSIENLKHGLFEVLVGVCIVYRKS